MSPERVMLWLLAGVTLSSIAIWVVQDSVFDGATAFAVLSSIVAVIWGISRYDSAVKFSGMGNGGVLNFLTFAVVTAGLTYWCIAMYDFPLVGSIIGSICTIAYVWWTFGMLEPGNPTA
ncbi:hypothetical protein N9V30_01855 [Candidatus Poseidoniales archaeon]|nr:hypothetical protein [Candidatus Poseidoniales archaeon]MDB2541968.1 hypothetical protein [Candidatus Poseidoniales archaeon]|tara:strand:- start:245 stop:601 length:357 start_codon:yes stop_codon:yes gene_type:complete